MKTAPSQVSKTTFAGLWGTVVLVFGAHPSLKRTTGKNIVWVPGWRPEHRTPTPLHTRGQKKCFWIPGMGVFEPQNAKNYCVGSGVALQTPIPLHTRGQQSCFWLPGTGVFETYSAQRLLCGFWGGAPNRHLCADPGPQKGVFGYLGWVCLKRTMPKQFMWVLGWRSKHPYLCTPRATKRCIVYLGWVRLKRTVPKNIV